MNKVVCQPVGDVPWYRKMLRFVPGFCNYCGFKYVDAYSTNVNLLVPLPQNGRCCPHGHEGYVDEVVSLDGSFIRHEFDNLE